MSRSPSAPLRTGIIGLGGFAGAHHEALIRLEACGAARLIATCDPRPDAFVEQCRTWRFGARGVRVFPDYRALLEACARELDLIVIPTPISLHAEMHRVAVEHRVPVYLEKPPTLDHEELESMIAIEETAVRDTFVGFSYIAEPVRRQIKRRVLDGEFGALREGRLLAHWPRARSYFKRNNWAGCLLGPDGRPILDSCLGNATSHFVHNLLFWAGGPGMSDWADVASVRAELYRAHAIEGADTFFVEAATPGGVNLRIGLSHACAGTHRQFETLRCERATLTYVNGSHWEVAWHDGRIEHELLSQTDYLLENHLHYHRYLRGEIDRPATRLVDCRPFVRLNDLAYISSGEITPITGDWIQEEPTPDGASTWRQVRSIDETLQGFGHDGVWPSSRGWPRPCLPAPAAPGDLGRLRAALARMQAAVPCRPSSDPCAK